MPSTCERMLSARKRVNGREKELVVADELPIQIEDLHTFVPLRSSSHSSSQPMFRKKSNGVNTHAGLIRPANEEAAINRRAWSLLATIAHVWALLAYSPPRPPSRQRPICRYVISEQAIGATEQ